MNHIAQAPPPAPTAVGSVVLNIGIFLAFVAITLVFVYRASRTNKTASDYYAAGRSFTRGRYTRTVVPAPGALSR